MSRKVIGNCPDEDSSRGAEIGAEPSAPRRCRGFVTPAGEAIAANGHK